MKHKNRCPLLGKPCPDIMYRILSFVDGPTYYGVVCSCKENMKTAEDVRNSVWCLYSLHLDYARVSGPFPHGTIYLIEKVYVEKKIDVCFLLSEWSREIM